MDYLEAKWSYQVRKVLRYISLYGISKTFVKVVGQAYTQGGRHGWLLRVFSLYLGLLTKRKIRSCPKVAFVGLGNFSFTTLAYYSHRSGAVCVGAYDLDLGRTSRFVSVYGGGVCSSVDEIISSNPDLVFIASNHSTHTEYALDCLRAGISVHIEKPVSTSLEQAKALNSVMRDSAGKVFTGYNRPGSELFKKLLQRVVAEKGPATVNWFIAGHAIDPTHWYFAPAEGGRVLGNLCHWLDLTIDLVGEDHCFPVIVNSPTRDWLGSDFLVNLEFGDGSVATLSFSAKGHTFEGVRERLNYHRGNLLAYLADFQLLEIDQAEQKSNFRLWRRDHGHRNNVLQSLSLSNGESACRVLLTSLISLAVNEAILKQSSFKIDTDLELIAIGQELHSEGVEK